MDEPTATLVRAARVAFDRYGPDRATMTDVAREAGVVRQTLYNTVSSRDKLVELAMIQCCEDLQQKIDTWRIPQGDPGEALVEFLARAVEITADDAELAALSAALPPAQVRAVFGESHPVLALISQSLDPILRRCEEAGVLRAEITVEEADRWLQGVLTFALLRDEGDPVALRDNLRRFALPSVLTV